MSTIGFKISKSVKMIHTIAHKVTITLTNLLVGDTANEEGTEVEHIQTQESTDLHSSWSVAFIFSKLRQVF